MRSRNLKPGFCRNEDLAECSISARYLGVMLPMLADRQGRMEYRVRRIRMDVFPADPEVDVEGLIDELEGAGFVRRYTVDGRTFLWIPNFKKHQRPHVDEPDSVLPPHPEDPDPDGGKARVKKVPGPVSTGGDGGDTSDARCGHGGSTVEARCGHGVGSVSARSGSRLLNTDCGMRNADSGMRKGAAAPVSVSAVLSVEDGTGAVVGRLLALGDGPEYGRWWEVVLARMEACDGLGTLLEALEHAEDCGSAAVRAAKGKGPMTAPANFVAAACGKWLKAHGGSLPRPPGPSRAGVGLARH